MVEFQLFRIHLFAHLQLINGLYFNILCGDIYGGLTAAMAALPLAMAMAMDVASGVGPIASLYGAIFVSFFAALSGGTPAQVSGPTGPTGPMTVVMAAIFVQYTGMFPDDLMQAQCWRLPWSCSAACYAACRAPAPPCGPWSMSTPVAVPPISGMLHTAVLLAIVLGAGRRHRHGHGELPVHEPHDRYADQQYKAHLKWVNRRFRRKPGGPVADRPLCGR
jgi:MFS superfamily sulfate permease-like transporter